MAQRSSILSGFRDRAAWVDTCVGKDTFGEEATSLAPDRCRMSVILEFNIDAEDFRLGQVLSGPPDMEFELERIVPTGNMVMPFLWVTGDAHPAFEEHVQNNSAVEELLLLDKLDHQGLYRIEWRESPTDLIDAIAKAEGSILQARGADEWTFRVRFNDRDRLSQFHKYVNEQGVPLQIDRIYALSEVTDRGHRFDLTADQHEALRLALQQGYFATPREVTLNELAEELGITRQALSNRIRRGNEIVLRTALLSSVTNEHETG